MQRLWRRLLFLACSLWAIVTLSFVLLYRLPGDPARMILGPQASAESVAEFRRAQWLDRPLPNQYGHYLIRLVQLDLGSSFSLRQPVSTLLRERGAVTLRLALVAALFVFLLGFCLPVILHLLAGGRGISSSDRLLSVVALAPPYVLATWTVIVGAGRLPWISAIFDLNQPQAWLVPSAVLSAYPAALVLRIFSERLDEEFKTPYALRAKALGLPRWFVLLREVVPNALPAALAALLNGLAYFITGTLFVEVVFGIPGLGRLTQDALRNKDTATIGGVCLLFGVIILLLSTLLDIFHERLDPRSLHGASDDW